MVDNINVGHIFYKYLHIKIRQDNIIVKLYLRRLTGDPVSVFQYYIRSHIPTLSLALHLVLVGCPAARTNVSRHLCLHIFLLCGHYSGSRLTWSWWLDPEIFSDLTLPVTMICFVWRNHLVRAESCYPGESQSRTETGGKRAWLHPSPHSHHRRSPVSLIWPRQCWWWCILLAIV